jgi:hypothetical protein
MTWDFNVLILLLNVSINCYSNLMMNPTVVEPSEHSDSDVGLCGFPDGCRRSDAALNFRRSPAMDIQ